MSTDLVLGSAGCLGSAVCAALVASRRTVRALDLLPTGVPGVEEHVGDMGDAALLRELLRGVDTVHQCASLVSLHPGRREELREVNVLSNRVVLEACREAGVRAFVYASTQVLCCNPGEAMEGIDESVPYAQRPVSAFAEVRIESERDVLAASAPGGLQTLALRIPSVYGPRDRFHLPLHLTLSERGLSVRAGNQERCSHVYSENAAHAFVLGGEALRAGRCGGKVYYLSDETPPQSYWDTMGELLVACGRRPPRGRVPRPIVALLAHLSEAFYRVFGGIVRMEPVFSYEALTVASSNCWFDTRAIREDLGWSAPIPRAEAVRRTAAWFGSNPRPKALIG